MVLRNKELPPRARRILGDDDLALTPQGTTSACAENTSPPTASHAPKGNYLRVRGEYLDDTANTCGDWELPPRARRIHTPSCLGGGTCGTTSACAENTPSPHPQLSNKRNYLRVRGEYDITTLTTPNPLELPPRARRILSVAKRMMGSGGTTSACAENTCRLGVGVVNGGTTSACAENTEWCVMHIENERNYLRVRGEYSCCQTVVAVRLELPPRARRIP